MPVHGGWRTPACPHEEEPLQISWKASWKHVEAGVLCAEAATQYMSKRLKIVVFLGCHTVFFSHKLEWGRVTSCSILNQPTQLHSLVTTAVCRDPQLALTASEPRGRSSRAGKGWTDMKAAGAPSSASAILPSSESSSFSPVASEKR